MPVTIKDLSINLDVKNNGVEFEVKDNSGTHLGDLFITKAKVIWCPGRTTRENGRALTWAKFAKMMEDL